MRILTSSLILAFLGFAGCQTSPSETSDAPKLNLPTGISEMSPVEAHMGTKAAYSQLIDVRTPEEFVAEHADRARNIPLDTLATNLDKLEKNEPVYIICRTDNRSRQAAAILTDAGFSQAIVIKGGTEAWKAAGLPMGGPVPSANTGNLDERTRKALLAALEDERRAYATYTAVLAKFPGARPFSNIVEAEKRHELFLLPLLAKYGVPEPRNEFDPMNIPVPATLAEACKAGVTAEEKNIALYDSFFGFVAEQDIKDVFVRLQGASRDNHLPAFTRCSEGRGGNGPGRERRFGRQG